MSDQEEKEVNKELNSYDLLKEPMEIGKVFVESGMFKDVKTQAQAVVKILAGKEMGLSPFEAMNNLYIVNDKVGIMSNAMASIVKKSKKYDYEVVTLTETECVIKFFLKNGDKKEIGESSFTFKDAAKAGLVNKEVWKSYPRNMLFARALSNGVRFYCPDASYGYSVEELKDIDSPKGITTQSESKAPTVLDEVLFKLKSRYPEMEDRKKFLTDNKIEKPVKELTDSELTSLLEIING